jgi:hypothetical protein
MAELFKYLELKDVIQGSEGMVEVFALTSPCPLSSPKDD